MEPDDNVINNSPIEFNEPTQHSSAGIVVLQWLTYGFWGWAILALGILVSAIFANVLVGEDTSQTTIYALAAILVLLPIAYVCDYFYSKNEPTKKTGAAMFVMVIHAILFAFIGIGTLIAAVFSTVQIITNANDPSLYKVVLYSSMIMTFVYIAVFLRTINPAQFNFIPRLYKLIMLVFSIIVIIGAIMGPIAYSQQTKNDRLIENYLNDVSDAVNSYTRKNGKLPDSLNEVTFKGDAKILIDKKLVVYKPNTIKSKITKSGTRLYSDNYYQLCVKFVKQSPNYNQSSNSDYQYDDASYDSDEGLTNKSVGYSNNSDTYSYTSSPSGVYSHPAGEKCYNVRTSGR